MENITSFNSVSENQQQNEKDKNNEQQNTYNFLPNIQEQQGSSNSFTNLPGPNQNIQQMSTNNNNNNNNNNLVNNINNNMNQNNFINSNKMEQNPFVLNQQIVDQFYLQQLCGGGNQQPIFPYIQPELFMQEYTSKQMSNITDSQQKIGYHKQLLQSIQQELNAAQKKLNVIPNNLNEHFEKFFQKSGQTFSEKFSKPRPMSYKQNQSVLLKKEIQNQKNQSSKFHNMTKLLMYTFLQMFQQENLESLGLPDFIQVHLKKLARNIKLSGKKPKGPNNVIKTDCFNHAHYNALFLIITPENIKELQKHEREIEVHQTCFGIDLSQKPFLDQQKLSYVNIIKRFTYLVVKHSIGELVVEGGSNTRTEYLQRAMVGINKLNQGNMIQRF